MIFYYVDITVKIHPTNIIYISFNNSMSIYIEKFSRIFLYKHLKEGNKS